ncbi:MAG: hypothetical protein GY714_20160 [Desulfobacterales bacterium]|nr:hypothetical protein [Desulfobacterales bacterium]
MRVELEGPPDADIMFVGEAPGETEDKLGKPFSGRAGRTLNNLLAQAGIARYQCIVTNVAKERPPANRISYFFEDKKCTIPKPKMQAWVNELKEDIELYKPNIIVALGATALWALTGEKKISIFRGYIIPCSLVPGVKVIPIYHPQAINYDWKLYFQSVLDFRKALRHSKTPELPEVKQIYRPNVNLPEFLAYMEECITNPEWDRLAIDVETVQPGSHIEELGLSHSPDFGISIFLLKGRIPTLPEKDELLLWQTFARLVKTKKIIMQNGAYDIGILWYNQHILIPDLYMDTLIAAHVCWPELPRDLGFLGSVCLNVPPWKSGSAKNELYNPADAANTFGISEVLDLELSTQKVRHTFNFEMGLIPVALMMQLQGIKVDRETQTELKEKWNTVMVEMKTQLDTIIGREINFNSPKQMQELLYGDLKLPAQYKRRKSVRDKRTLTTDAAALRKLAGMVPDNPIFNLILDYKKANTLLRFLDVKLSPESRVHTSYNITGASSDDEEDTKKTKRSFGRWSSSKSIILPFGSGNLQNIPPEARKMYLAEPGWTIIQADLIQAEAVVVSHLTGNTKMQQMFKDAFGLANKERKPYDIHVLKATELFGVPWEEVNKVQRKTGKVIRHARNYSAGPGVLANRLGITMSDAKKLIVADERVDPSLGLWHLSIQEELKRNRVLTNLLGRKHRFLDRWGDTLFRSAYSYIPQSTIGDLLNVSLRKVYDKLLEVPFEVKLLLQLHDALYPMVRNENVNETIKLLRDNMLHPLTYNNQEFTIDVDFKLHTSWAEGEELEINWKEVGDGIPKII